MTTEFMERLGAQDQSLYRIEQTLAAIVETLVANRMPATMFVDAIEGLCAGAYAHLDEAA